MMVLLFSGAGTAQGLPCRRFRRCAGIAEPSGVPAPMGQKTQYRDGFFEKAFMSLFARKMEKFSAGAGKAGRLVVGGASGGDYDGSSTSRGGDGGQVAEAAAGGGQGGAPLYAAAGAPAQFRKLFPRRDGRRIQCCIDCPFFHWLVGPSEVVEVEVNGVKQRSGVHIKKCRYLENSGCVGMCVNMCKIPTQDFFTNEFGLP
uniref:Beta-carotene isomerase D27-like C-terminal domain-containing protein n=1 Tax=Ananas comosus var. bracteatus TaxID=296719 RepID=A0A6V7QCM3_ANACO|nr:unnamed protein product [Ananas comosus var. bracteatus]